MEDPLINNFKKTTRNTSKGIAKGLTSFSVVKLGLTSGVVIGLGALFFMTGALGDTKFSVTLTSNPDLEDGLIVHYTFDGKDLINNATDRSGNGNNGNLTSFTSTTTINGKIGQALEFDGSSNYIDADDVAAIDSTTTLSVCAWAKHNSLNSDDAIASKVSGSNNGFIFWRDDAGALSGRTDTYTFYVEDSTDADNTRVEGATGASILDTWTHICGTVETGSATGIRLYINGTEDANSPGSTSAISAFDAGSLSLFIANWNAGSKEFDGALDDVRIYDRVLSAVEISRLYDLGATTHIGTTITSNPTLEDDLIGHWTFDGKDTINNVSDRSGVGHNGFINGQTSTTTVNGKIGQGLELDGSDDYVEIELTQEASSEITQAFWLYIHTLPSESAGSFQDLIDKDGDTWNLFFRKGTGNLEWKMGTSGGDIRPVVNESELTKNAWNHITATYDGSLKKLYINGVEKDSDSTSGTITDTANTLFIGRENSSATSFTDGVYDDVRIYNRALSADEVSRLYDLGATTHIDTTVTSNPDLETGLVGHWTFDGKHLINNATDRSGQGNTGFLSNFTSTTTIRGKIGQALDFDGSDDYVDAGTHSITTSQPWSMAGWFVMDDTSDFFACVFGITNPSDGTQRVCLGKDNGIADVKIVSDGETAGNGSLLTEGMFHHGVLVYDGSAFLLYLDGALDYSVTPSGSDWQSATDVWIGQTNNASDHDWDGAIDDVRIYNRALSASEVQRLYELGS